MKILVELLSSEPVPGDDLKLLKRFKKEMKLQFGSVCKSVTVVEEVANAVQVSDTANGSRQG